MRRSRASGGLAPLDMMSARGSMVGGLTVDAALAQLRRLQLRWPDESVAHAWPVDWTVDSVLFAPYGARQGALVRVRKVHRLAPKDVVEIEVKAICRDQTPTARVHTDHLQLVARVAIEVTEHLTAYAYQDSHRRVGEELVLG